MIDYAAAILFMCIAMGILCILVHENGRFDWKMRARLYITYAFIALSALTEMGALLLNGAPDWTRIPHAVIKCVDYIITPCAACCFALQVTNIEKIDHFFWGFLCANGLVEAASIFTGWTFYIDEGNVYHHGPYHFIYVAVYIVAIIYTLIRFIRYGKRFVRTNRQSLISIVALTTLGILMQEIWHVKVCCLALTLGAILMYIHYNEFAQQTLDERVNRQHKLLETDALTGLFNRYAYNEALNEYDERQPDPDTVVFSIDANGLKEANDTKGHLAGDELIRGAAQCISAALRPYGRCFRTGGDEFVVIAQMREGDLERAMTALDHICAGWKGEMVDKMSLAVGHAIAREHPELTMEKLFSCADRDMYAAKAEYYRLSGHDRRRRN